MDARCQDDPLVGLRNIGNGETLSRSSNSVTLDIQYNGNHTSVKAWIETTVEGQIRLGKNDLWELGISTPATEFVRAVSEDNDENSMDVQKDQP